MDTAEYDTNTLLISNIATISFRIFEPLPDSSHIISTVALDVENTLRQDGHIVYFDGVKRCFWHFQIHGKDGHEEVNSHGLDSSLTLCGVELAVVEDGVLEPTSFQRSRSQPHQAIQTPTSTISNASAFEQSQRNLQASAMQGGMLSSQDPELRVGDWSGTDAKSGATVHKIAYENFITAVLLSITSVYCNHTGALPLNYRTILLAPDPLHTAANLDTNPSQCPVVAMLKAYWTTTGALIICFSVTQCKGLAPITDPATASSANSSANIIAAPFGVVSNNQASSPGEPGTASLAQTPNTQALSLRNAPDANESMWKQACLKVLRLRGVASSGLRDCPWVSLAVPKPKLQDVKPDLRRAHGPNSALSIPWPMPLCFRKKAVDVSSTSRVGNNLLSGYEENHDPLSSARGWFNAASDRDERVSKRKAERASASKEAMAAESRVVKTNAPPAVVRRPSAAAASTIYPTPPDGIQHINGVTPSIDGALSSPGNPLSAPPPPEIDHASFHSGNVGDTLEIGPDAIGPDPNESKRRRSGSNLLDDADHIFGEIGGDMFDDHDITEADFNFFDEQPDDLDLDVTMDDVGVVPQTGDVAVEAEAEPNDPVHHSKPTAAPERDAAVFAKPELRHARSSRNDPPGQHTQESRSSSTKREPSPFDPHTVFKRVRASVSATGQGFGTKYTEHSRASQASDMKRLDPGLSTINKKYEQGGQFDYRKISSLGKPKVEEGTLPETDYLRRHAKQNKRARDCHFHAESLMRGLAVLEPHGTHLSPSKLDGSLSDDYDSSAGSDEDDSSYTSEEPASPIKSSVKMLVMDDDAVSQVTSLKDLEPVEEPDHQIALELPRLSKPESPELPLSLLYSDPEPLSLELYLSDEEMIQVAQILTDQATTGCLDIFNGQDGAKMLPATSLHTQTPATDARNALQILHELVPLFLKGVGTTNLKGLLDITDVPLMGQPTRVQPRPIPGRDSNAEPLRPSNLYQIPGPHLEVRRAETRLSVLPSAVLFWESLGLAPSSGGKDVNAICIFPGWNGMADNARTFLGCLKSVYETLKLGTFESINVASELEDGVLPYEVDRISTSPDTSVSGHGSALAETMGTVLGVLSKLEVAAANIVVYFVYSPSNPGTIVEACIAFQRLFESYRKVLTARREVASNELVLQLVSANLLSSPTAVVVTPAPEIFKLGMETYDRCTMFGGPMPAPAIRLEQPLPRIIDFKLTMSPSASLIRENSCIHVAYAQSIDERWITAAWTDDRGNQQESASYCLGRKGRPPSRSANEVAHEIWESTLNLISVWKVHWRVVITKCGPMDQQEMDFWADLARTEIKASVTMILMTVDTNPSLQLLPPPVKLLQPTAPLYTTPVSTPQASILSPEQMGTPATPARDANATAATPGAEGGGESEYEAVLSDVTDQTWGAVVGHRLNNSLSVIDVHPALASGYLIKRTGSKVEDAPVLMEVNLVHTDASPRAYEPLLREMLSYFRGLGTLARARGVVQRETDVRPWHIAAAEKGVRALYLLM
ncbi:hypothetical protein HIM_07427 [Hirsutella minnesotensis 3608]|uniref:Mediator of RNA polymerase II transcription subunit 13 n=1 Tax=Hirsutella minnesotensis 3608 TaxID=1043627 RepID=A0A0F7ZN69_9HYPO|nr:hypothetical protein HIM_07427 [Hirsutella minnesotensis 3608]